MAVVLGNPFGNLRGRIGNNVFSANKSGNIIRSYTTPTSPNTPAQLWARANFATVVGAWRLLTSHEKTEWNEYANNYFKPKRLSHTNNYSGFQAFMAVQSCVRNAIQKTRDYTLYNLTTDVTASVTKNVYQQIFEVGGKRGIIPVLGQIGGDSAPLMLGTVQVNDLGDFSVELLINNRTDSGEDVHYLMDNTGRQYGLAVYMSNGNPSDNMSYKKPMQYALGYLESFSVNTPPLAMSNMNFYSSSPINPGDYLDFPLNGEFVVITVYLCGIYGELVRLGAKEVQVSSISPP